MADLLVGFVLGLLVGWNLLPQPTWVKTGWGWAWGKFKKVAAQDSTDTSNTA